MVLNEIRLAKKNAPQLSHDLDLDMNRLMALLRSLRLRGVAMIWM